jgi:hypothetical protein
MRQMPRQSSSCSSQKPKDQNVIFKLQILPEFINAQAGPFNDLMQRPFLEVFSMIGDNDLERTFYVDLMTSLLPEKLKTYLLQCLYSLLRSQ